MAILPIARASFVAVAFGKGKGGRQKMEKLLLQRLGFLRSCAWPVAKGGEPTAQLAKSNGNGGHAGLCAHGGSLLGLVYVCVILLCVFLWLLVCVCSLDYLFG